LHEALDGLKIWQSPDVIEGIATFDDAGIYRIDDRTALVQTVDFFTPVVDDPYAFGQVAAANSLSDVYAMGGRPITALNILCYPAGDLPPGDLNRILQGGADKLKEAGCSLLGGHSVIDKELKFGCSITGLIDPKEVWSNAGAKAGHRLVLTKPLGTGILGSAIKQGKLDAESEAEVTRNMAALNRGACEAGRKIGGVSAATDITGFGLAGHAGQMAKASGVTIRIDAATLPIYPRAAELAKGGLKTRGDKSNRAFLKGRYETAASVEPVREDLCFDPQTSGGLLLVVAPDRVDSLVSALKAASTPSAAVIGEVLPRRGDLDLLIS
jgi:selenide, water dikinase